MPPSGPAGLKQELGLRDLVLTQILFVVGLGNFGNSAKLGASHVVFWLAAIVLFYSKRRNQYFEIILLATITG